MTMLKLRIRKKLKQKNDLRSYDVLLKNGLDTVVNIA